MTWGRALSAAVMLAIVAVAVSAAPASAGSTTLLRLNGIGPLKLGMTQDAALRTGWLAQRRRGCPLGGRPFPVTYQLTGRRAPDGLRGMAEFRRGRLRNISVTRGARTARGVRVGRTTLRRMVRVYRDRRFRASSQFLDVFQGTLVTVRWRRGHQVLGGFGSGRRVSLLAIPAVPFCE